VTLSAISEEIEHEPIVVKKSGYEIMLELAEEMRKA
jgi:hypothetical protein